MARRERSGGLMRASVAAAAPPMRRIDAAEAGAATPRADGNGSGPTPRAHRPAALDSLPRCSASGCWSCASYPIRDRSERPDGRSPRCTASGIGEPAARIVATLMLRAGGAGAARRAAGVVARRRSSGTAGAPPHCCSRRSSESPTLWVNYGYFPIALQIEIACLCAVAGARREARTAAQPLTAAGFVIGLGALFAVGHRDRHPRRRSTPRRVPSASTCSTLQPTCPTATPATPA